MMNSRSSRSSVRGFSLIELMVGVVVALLTTVVIFRSYQAYEGQRRTTGAASDTVANGQFVTSFLAREMGQAGWGFQFGSGGVGCNFSAAITAPTWGNYTQLGADGTLLTTPTGIDQRIMVPVMIADSGATSGVENGPDALRIMYSSSISAVPISGTLSTATTFRPTSTVTFQQGDMVLLENSTGARTCQLGQITNTNPDTATGVEMATGTGPCVRGASACTGSAFNPSASLVGSNWIANLGALTVNTYSVQGNTLWQYGSVLGNSYDAGHLPTVGPNTGAGFVRDTTGTSLQTAVSQDVVNFQAEYGLDTLGLGTPGAQTNDIDSWLPATGNYAPAALNNDTGGGRTFAQRIRAIRYLVVTRSALPEKKDASGNCTATPSANRYTTLTWPNGVGSSSTTPGSATIQVDLATNEPSPGTWGCYRYQFFMDTVPLRSVIWSVRGYE